MGTREKAIEVIRSNDMGGHTIPTSGLYPFQWNWDSCLTSLGLARFDRDRAWREIETLFKGQWQDGMVPHIIFWADDEGYFPGKDVWDSRTDPPSSGHSQPPVASSAVWSLVRSGGKDDHERARELFPSLMSYHRWYHEFRDPNDTGVVAITHPWESGRDNSPDWDAAMAAVEVPADLGEYQRKDLQHVDAKARPTKEQYDCFLALVKHGRECGWDHKEIYDNGQFLAADPGVQFMLLRSDRDLLTLAETLGKDDETGQLREWIEASEAGCESLWSDDLGGYCAKDMRGGSSSTGLSNASMLAWYAGVVKPEQAGRMADAARSMLNGVDYGMPSWAAHQDGFDSRRYWRGPVWAIMNYMIAEGMLEQGEKELALRMRMDIMRLISEHGFREYFDPVSGEGAGGDNFTWTAAIWLAWDDGQLVGDL